jgi:pyruvate formate lyase activating enzyme
MIISGLVRTSLVDFPGQVAAAVFTQGCDLDCFFCHNRTLIPAGAGTISEQKVTDFLGTRRGLLDGVVITGGEPTLQPDLPLFIERIKQMGFLVKLDTNGQQPDIVMSLIERNLLDFIAVDYKAPAGRYNEICGDAADPERTRALIHLLAKRGIDYHIRTTMIPQLKEEDLLKMAHELPQRSPWVLNAYRKPEYYRQSDFLRIDEKPYTQEQLNDIVTAMKCFQVNITTS